MHSWSYIILLASVVTHTRGAGTGELAAGFPRPGGRVGEGDGMVVDGEF